MLVSTLHFQENKKAQKWFAFADQDAMILVDSLALNSHIRPAITDHPGWGHRIFYAAYFKILNKLNLFDIFNIEHFRPDPILTWSRLVLKARDLSFFISSLLLGAAVGILVFSFTSNKWWALFGFSIWLFLPGVSLQSVLVRSEPISSLFGCLSLIALVYSVRIQSNPWNSVLLTMSGVFFGLACFTKIQAIPYIAIALFYIMFKTPSPAGTFPKEKVGIYVKIKKILKEIYLYFTGFLLSHFIVLLSLLFFLNKENAFEYWNRLMYAIYDPVQKMETFARQKDILLVSKAAISTTYHFFIKVYPLTILLALFLLVIGLKERKKNYFAPIGLVILLFLFNFTLSFRGNARIYYVYTGVFVVLAITLSGYYLFQYLNLKNWNKTLVLIGVIVIGLIHFVPTYLSLPAQRESIKKFKCSNKFRKENRKFGKKFWFGRKDVIRFYNEYGLPEIYYIIMKECYPSKRVYLEKLKEFESRKIREKM